VQGHAIKALLLVIWGVTALSLIDNFLYPILVRNQIRLHTLVVFFSTLGGLSVFGLLGFVIGPIVATLALTLIEVVSEYYTRLEVKEPSEQTEISIAEPPN
jgi:predicted PurR-regulated permease PerM